MKLQCPLPPAWLHGMWGGADAAVGQFKEEPSSTFFAMFTIFHLADPCDKAGTGAGATPLLPVPQPRPRPSPSSFSRSPKETCLPHSWPSFSSSSSSSSPSCRLLLPFFQYTIEVFVEPFGAWESVFGSLLLLLLYFFLLLYDAAAALCGHGIISFCGVSFWPGAHIRNKLFLMPSACRRLLLLLLLQPVRSAHSLRVTGVLGP